MTSMTSLFFPFFCFIYIYIKIIIIIIIIIMPHYLGDWSRIEVTCNSTPVGESRFNLCGFFFFFFEVRQNRGRDKNGSFFLFGFPLICYLDGYPFRYSKCGRTFVEPTYCMRVDCSRPAGTDELAL
jgi:hypothetical protein